MSADGRRTSLARPHPHHVNVARHRKNEKWRESIRNLIDRLKSHLCVVAYGRFGPSGPQLLRIPSDPRCYLCLRNET
jgi:hypothetical protein